MWVIPGASPASTGPGRAPRAPIVGRWDPMADEDRRRRLRRPALRAPASWRLTDSAGPRPFVAFARFERPDGSTVEWSSRRHRKGLGLRPAGGRVERHWRRPAAPSIVMGALFMVGSACFAAGSLPAFADAVSTAAVGWTFFVGSLAFTSAAFAQFREAVTAPGGVDDPGSVPHGRRRWGAWAPERIDWWASAVQLLGTLAFNVTTFAATRTSPGVVQERRWIWVPDVVGSICFLVASWLAYAEAAAGGHGFRGRGVGWWICWLNLAGSVAFGLAAVGARYLRTTGEIADIALVNLGTLAGAVAFFLGAALLPVESARESA